MKLKQVCLAIAVLGACGAASAQQAVITQSGSNDTATVEQTNAIGATIGIFQTGGNNNTANSLQVNTGPGIASATISQQGTGAATGKVTQIGVTGVTSTQLTQSAGANMSADILQGNMVSGQIIASQTGMTQQMMLQQFGGDSGVYMRTAQNGSNSGMTVLQGQPSGAVTNSQARAFQSGDSNQVNTVQANGNNLNAYTAQGLINPAGSYYSNQAGGFVVVDATVVAVASTGSTADVFQGGGSNHTGYILQYGSALSGYITQSGDSNTAGILQTGASNSANITQSGVGGVATVSQRGVGAYASLTQSGVGNTATVTQR